MKKEYEKIVLEYFRKKGKAFLNKYQTFESLNKANNKALQEWAKVKDDIRHHKIYHKHANLSTAFKTIKRSMPN